MNDRQKKKKESKHRMRNKELCKKYPFLIPRSAWTGKTIKDYDYSWTMLDAIPDGWRLAFGQLLIDELRDALIKDNYLHGFYFTQIKEKYGRLRLYSNGGTNKVNQIISKYEHLSGYVCIYCGSPYGRMMDIYGYILPVCKECWDKSNERKRRQGRITKEYEEMFLSDEYNGMPTEMVVHTLKHSDETGKYEENVDTYDLSDTVSAIIQNYKKRKAKNK